ncbi:ECs_2282 family putative zinc-binding protein [Phaeobacter marinintestinus]|uniref:ECs_2282 family putative zinc-binding protein n=1 Tax=Falsiphaeobacter marinintestinus TaxID=1492905 RepID=UPI0011B459F1|nr:hypothetical protein [Phaeobacter marinintestinus]
MKTNYDRSIELLCPTCASTFLSCQDELENEDSMYRCSSCDGEFSYETIKASNEDRIAAKVEEIKSEVFADIKKDFKKMFK